MPVTGILLLHANGLQLKGHMYHSTLNAAILTLNCKIYEKDYIPYCCFPNTVNFSVKYEV